MKKLFWLVLVVVLISCDVDKSRVDKAKVFIDNKEYDSAIKILSRINYSSDYYVEKNKLLDDIETLRVLNDDLFFKNKIEEDISLGYYYDALNTLKRRDTLNEYYRFTSVKIDSLIKVKDQLQIKIIVDRFKKAIKDLDNKNDFNKYDGSVSSVLKGVAFFNNYNDIISDNWNQEDKRIRSVSGKLKAKLKSLQKREFPKLRKRYVRFAANKMWENDIYVSCDGYKNTYLNFTGGLFASNKNIKNYSELLYDVADKLKFKKIRFRWHDRAGYTEYDLSNNDSDLD